MASTLEILSVAASDMVVATISDDPEHYRGELRLWSLDDGAALRTEPVPTTFGGSRDPGGRSLLMCPQRAELLLTAHSGLELISLAGGERTQLGGIPRSYGPASADYARDGSVFGVLTTRHVKIWDAQSRALLGQHTENESALRQFTAFAIAPDGSEVAVAVFPFDQKNEGLLEVYGIPDLSLRRRTETTNYVTSMEWTQGGLFVGQPLSMTLHDPESLQASKHARVMTTRAFSHDGLRFASVSIRGDRADLVNLDEEWRSIRLFEGQKGPVGTTWAALARRGTRLVCGRGPELTVWDTDACTQVWQAEIA